MSRFLENCGHLLSYLKKDLITFVLLPVVILSTGVVAHRVGFGSGKASVPTEPELNVDRVIDALKQKLVPDGAEGVPATGPEMLSAIDALKDELAEGHGHEEEPTTWTCSMHPQIQMPKPGACPLCGMDLIPLAKRSGDGAPRRLVMSPAAMALAEIRTRPVERRVVTHTLRMVGKVHYDETRLAYITAWFPGRLDRLYVDYTGVTVRKGDHLVYIYSPELLSAQQERLEAVKGLPPEADADKSLLRMAESLVRSAEEKLRLWGLSSDQIQAIRKRGKPEDHMSINSPVSGIVIHKNALEGMWVKTGSRIYTIADLSRVWVLLDAFESDLSWVHYGQEIEFKTEAYPDEVFTGKIAFISPVLSEKTRTVRLRVNVENPRGTLKPEMFVRATIKAEIAAKGTLVAPDLAGKWISPMHPEIIKDGPGDCDICGMDLVPVEELFKVAAAPEPPLIVPASAVLVTGKRAVAYVRVKGKKEPTFEGRTVVLGPRAGDYYLVEKGLEEGELVVVNGNFKLDSALQIQAETSMMMPEEEDRRPETRDPKIRTYEADENLTKSLLPFLGKYLALQEALASDDLEASKASLGELPGLLEQADASGLDDKAARGWRRLARKMAKALEHAGHLADLEGIRKLNVKLSDTWIAAVQSFSIMGEGDLHIARCPMANDDKGADWLQLTKQIRNPYFGASMLACGVVRKKLSAGGDGAGEDEEQEGPQASEPSHLESDAAFRTSLSTFLGHYLTLQSALAGDDGKKSKETLLKLPEALKAIKAGGLKGDAAETWKGLQESFSEPLKHAGHAADIAAIRKLNFGLSNVAIKTVEAFGVPGDKPVYLAFCPMAGDGGGSWLQAGDELLNPYYGAEMLYCGEIKKKIEPRGAHKGHKH